MHNYSYWKSRPVENDFELEIISNHPEFKGRTIKQYSVEGINTIGVWGQEAFEVHFHNKSLEDVQVRISLDGTDILTGKAADLEVNHQMWLVRAGRTLHLKAWAENNEGGARFVFTSGDMGVALHAHGDISHKGIISAAVFTERDRKYVSSIRPYDGRRSASGAMRKSMSSGNLYSSSMSFDASPQSAPSAAVAGGMSTNSREEEIGDSLKREASVGAGEYTNQKTKTVKGLDYPVLTSVVRVRYMWYDDLLVKLKEARYEDPHPTGFPGQKIKTFADLSEVPRVASVAARIETKSNLDPDYYYRKSLVDQGPPASKQTFDRVVW